MPEALGEIRLLSAMLHIPEPMAMLQTGLGKKENQIASRQWVWSPFVRQVTWQATSAISSTIDNALKACVGENTFRSKNGDDMKT